MRFCKRLYVMEAIYKRVFSLQVAPVITVENESVNIITKALLKMKGKLIGPKILTLRKGMLFL